MMRGLMSKEDVRCVLNCLSSRDNRDVPDMI